MKTALLLLSLLPVFGTPVRAAAVAEPAPLATAAPGVDLLAGKRVLVLGDSITQQGTWVGFLDYLLFRTYPEKHFDIINLGLSSETTSGLSEPGHAGGKFPRPCVHERLERALKAVKPAVVIACYGMNDGIYMPYDEARMKAFEQGMGGLVAACKAAGAKVVLVTPPVFDGRGKYDEVLGRFAAWEMKSAPAGVVATVDLHTAMRAALDERRARNPKFRFAGDSVHPDDLGHLVMTLTVLKGLGLKVPEGTPESLLAQIKADPLWPLADRFRAVRAEGWLNHVGYTREKTVAPGTGDIVAVEKQAAALRVKMEETRRASK